MGRKKKGGGDGAAAHADDSVPFGFLLGEQYSGYYQALNSSKDLKPMPSSLPRLFLGLSSEQRRLLATRMLEGGHGRSGDELKEAIRMAAVFGEVTTRRRKRVAAGPKTWDNAYRDGGGLGQGIGGDGRPACPARYRPREPFLAVESEEVYTYGRGGRAQKARERAECAPARRRREVQELMRARVQVQEDYLAGLELDRREWQRHKTQHIKSHMVASKRQLLEARLNYGSDSPDGNGSDMMSFAPDHEKNRLQKQEVARALREARQLELQANVDGALMRRWEKTIVKSIKSDKRPWLWNAPASPPGTNSIVGGDPELVSAIRSLEEDYAACQPTPAITQEKTGGKGTSANPPGSEESIVNPLASTEPTTHPLVPNEPTAVPGLEIGQASAGEREALPGLELGQSSGGEGEPLGSFGPEVDGAPPVETAVGAPELSIPEHEPAMLEHEPAISEHEPAISDREPAAPEHEGKPFRGMGVKAQTAGAAGQTAPKAEARRNRVKTLVEKLLRTSNSVALAAARPLTIKPPTVLTVKEDARRARLSSRVRHSRQPYPLRPQSHSERSFVGGGYRTNRSAAGLPTRSGNARPARSGSASSAVSRPLPPHPALLPSSSKILDLEAVSIAGECGSKFPEIITAHPRNRFAPMSNREVERFLRSSWSSCNDYQNGFLVGEGEGGGGEEGGQGDAGARSAGRDSVPVVEANAAGEDDKVAVPTAGLVPGSSNVFVARMPVSVPGGSLLPPGTECFVRGHSLLDNLPGKSAEA